MSISHFVPSWTTYSSAAQADPILDDGDWPSPAIRSTKRRKLSVSSISSVPSPPPARGWRFQDLFDDINDGIIDDDPGDGNGGDQEVEVKEEVTEEVEVKEEEKEEKEEKEDHADGDDEDKDAADDDDDHDVTYSSLRSHFRREKWSPIVTSSPPRPEIRALPRPGFKKGDDHDDKALPDLFSPQRGRTNHASGPLASLAQAYLTETAAWWNRGETTSAYAMRVEVTAVRGAKQGGGGEVPRRMMLVQGKVCHDGAGNDGGERQVKLLLTGEGVAGAVSGLLGNAADAGRGVRAGCVIGVRRPTWELKLDEVVWTVVRHWKILESGG